MSCSQRQLWEAFWCSECDVKGLVNISIQFNNLQIFSWDDSSPIAQMAMKQDPNGDFG